MSSYIGTSGLTYLWGKLKAYFASKTDLEGVAFVDEDDDTSGTIDSGSSTLAGLEDTSISNPSNNQGLIYDSTAGKWMNKAIPGGGGSGEENVIEIVKVNGSALTPDSNKAVDVTVPTETTVTNWGFTKNTGTYSKPTGGIPKTDLATAVQTSLGKADTALQSYTETDPTVPSWAKQSSKPTYTASEVGALPDTTVIPTVPTNVSAFTNDANYVTSDNTVAVYSGSSAPSSSLGKNGDIYIQTN